MKQTRYHRSRDVFGKRITKRGAIILAFFEIVLIVGLYFLLSGTKNTEIELEVEKQHTIETNIAKINALASAQKEEITNIGLLIDNLPTSFNEEACKSDIDRIMSISTVEGDIPSFDKTVAMPFVVDVKTVKAVQLSFKINTDNVDSVITFIENLSDYEHEKFYYISSISIPSEFSKDSPIAVSFTVFTFYNEIEGIS